MIEFVRRGCVQQNVRHLVTETKKEKKKIESRLKSNEVNANHKQKQSEIKRKKTSNVLRSTDLTTDRPVDGGFEETKQKKKTVLRNDVKNQR